VQSSFKFCRHCGAALPEATPADATRTPPPMRPHGAPIDRASTETPSERLATPSTAAPPPTSRSSRRSPLVWTSALILLVLAVGTGLFYYRDRLPFGGSAPSSLRAEQHLNQGVTFAKMKDYDNAVTEFTRALEHDGASSIAYANRGVAYMQQRKFNKALDDLKKAEELNPKDRMVFYNQVAVFSVQNQRDRALDALDRALALGFNDYDALRSDPDLENVRKDPEFRKVLERHKVFLR
jgi:tetratricopeptide (TPR) repeat protein